MLVKGRTTAEVFVEFLKRLLVNAKSPIFLVVDGHSTHKAKAVQRCVRAQDRRLDLHFLPPHSPELSPDEWVWNHLKNHTLGRKRICSEKEMRAMIRSHLRRMQQLLALIASFSTRPPPRMPHLLLGESLRTRSDFVDLSQHGTEDFVEAKRGVRVIAQNINVAPKVTDQPQVSFHLGLAVW